MLQNFTPNDETHPPPANLPLITELCDTHPDPDTRELFRLCRDTALCLSSVLDLSPSRLFFILLHLCHTKRSSALRSARTLQETLFPTLRREIPRHLRFLRHRLICWSVTYFREDDGILREICCWIVAPHQETRRLVCAATVHEPLSILPEGSSHHRCVLYGTSC